MARTSDPHAATVKAWQTRARASGSAGVVQLRNDYYAKRGWAGERDFRGASDVEVARVTETLRGKAWSLDDVADLVGAPPRSRVRIRVVGRDSLAVETTFPEESGLATGYNVRYIDLFGGRIKNANMDVVPPMRRSGLGASVFELEVETAIKLGMESIEVMAVGSPGGSDNGYYTWARFGFEATRPVRGPNGTMTTLHKIMQQPGGAKWWQANGRDFNGVFSLIDGSVSRRVWDEYRRLKKEKG